MLNWDMIPDETENEKVDRTYYNMLDISRSYKRRILETKQQFLQRLILSIQEVGLWQWLIPEKRKLLFEEEGTEFYIAIEEPGFLIRIETEGQDEKNIYEFSKSGIMDRNLIPFLDNLIECILTSYIEKRGKFIKED